ncbi:Sensor protein RstB [Andreprevotia sp. IGB-42]|uniref:ATP-binding protein n=1 Tax=Andreprevotia sp. IGB-42 TaxID=2497473 RepID=UPI001358CE63|nr:ATP-binding protein [Andreprevotia sp. IGB-42]KAF0812967.1 Sensor protein RstB [Andreprevotia sp. IGB-42]
MWKVLLRQLLLVVVLLPLSLFGINAIVASLISDQGDDYTRHTFVGALKTLEQELHIPPPLNEEQFQQNLARLQHSMGVLQLRVLPLAHFKADETALLQQGKLLNQLEPDRLSLLMRDGRVLTLQTPAPPSQLNAIIAVWGLTLLALAALLYTLQVRPFWRDLQRLREAAARLGEGELHTRVSNIRQSSSLQPLAERMNQMAAQIEQLVARQQELLNAVAHELRTPLARAYFSLDLQDGKNAAQIALLQQKLREDLGEIDTLINELLGYGKLDAREPLQLQAVALQPWLEQIQAAHSAGRCTITLAAIPVNAPITVAADERLLRHVLDNLIRNACRHAQTTVWISAHAEGQTMQLVVEDDGPGVPAADRERIFEPFVRLDDSRSRDTGGVGLGLALVKRIAQRHKGAVWVEPGAHGGARFVFAWPAVAEKAG